MKPAKSGYVAGAVLALMTAALLSLQEPLSAPAAHKLTGAQFVFVNEITLLVAAPMFLVEAKARKDFRAILASSRARLHLVALTGVGLAGLTVYNLGLRNAHPVVVTAILNLSPFWAALAARYVAGVPIPVTAAVFAGSLLAAFAGALTVAYSQTPADASGLIGMLTKGSWYFAIPVPLFTALGGTLVGLWFKDYSDSAAISSALIVSSAALVPVVALYLWLHGDGFAIEGQAAALLVVGTIAAAAVGRLLYQFALSQTNDDNGFVTMFFLLGPALAGFYSWLLAPWVEGVRFSANRAFFIGLAITGVSLLFFAVRARMAVAAREPPSSRKV